MKLKDYLTKCKNDKIAIGTSDGGSFLYFGKPDADAIKKVFTAYDKRKTETLLYDYKKLEGMIFSMPRFERAKNDEYSVSSKLIDRARDIHHLYGGINGIENWKKHKRKSFLNLDREVITVYDKKVDDCLAVIIQGDEPGKYILESEFLHSNI